jgi:RHS repeat-associated protein
VDAGGTAWYHQDVRGSVVALTDGNGTVQTQYAYDGFGNATVSGNTAFADEVRYTARFFDNLTGLQHNRARWYDPQTGRWISEDPMGFGAGDANLYRYAGNGQTNAVDPSGYAVRFVPRSHSPHDIGRYLVLDSNGQYIGYLISIGGVPHVMRNGIAISLDKIIAEDGRWFRPSTNEDWWVFLQGNGFAHDPNSPGQRCIADDAASVGFATNGRGYGHQGNVLGGFGDRRDAGMQAAIIVVAMAKSVGGGLAIDLAGTLIPFGKFAEYALEKGFALIKEGGKWVLVNVKTGARVAGREAEEFAAEAARALKRIPTGQIHHAISTKVHRALQKHKILQDAYKRRDPRLVTRAADRDSHYGYQRWHRDLDDEVVNWLEENPNACLADFNQWLRNRYNQPDLTTRFPNGLPD